jgi:hypothetical protein
MRIHRIHRALRMAAQSDYVRWPGHQKIYRLLEGVARSDIELTVVRDGAEATINGLNLRERTAFAHAIAVGIRCHATASEALRRMARRQKGIKIAYKIYPFASVLGRVSPSAAMGRIRVGNALGALSRGSLQWSASAHDLNSTRPNEPHEPAGS